MEGYEHDRKPTFTARICLHKLVLRASLGELRRKACQLRQDLVDQANFRGKIVLVDMKGEEASNVAYANKSTDR